MSMFHRLPAPLHRAFAEGRALKIISGLQNFDPVSVGRVVRAAQAGGATYVDIAADPRLVALAKRETQLPVCVSAVAPELLAQAVAAGADLVEIGNYDSFYAAGRVFSPETVVRLTCETRVLLPTTTLAVTVPHTLPLDAQVTLAEKLVEVGADLIQTEGGTVSQPQHAGTLGAIEKAAPTLAAAREISRAVAIPVICASGLSDVTVPLAIAAGARGVGVGSAVNKLTDEVLMVAAVRALRAALDGVTVQAIA
ncbi:MAG: DUF561 domain-containing protein [Pseudanabaenaceae cyanobacterium]